MRAKPKSLSANHRGGPTGKVEVVSQLHYSRFVNKARDFD